MPVLKPIAGHTSVKGVRDYLIHDGRALAQDFLNMSWDDLEMESAEEGFKETFDWADEMDTTREAFGNNESWHGLRARTYMHYVLSPDPEDRVSLEQLRNLSKAWAHENFPHHEVAIVYHEDNESAIPHAHIVVNNTDIESGYRLQVPKPRVLYKSLQNLAKERGLSFFADEKPMDAPNDGFAAFSAKRSSRVTQPRSRQEVYMRRAEAELSDKGEYSWVADIRSRVEVARSLASSIGEFQQIASILGIEVQPNSAKAKRPDWIFVIAEHPTWKISGENLGLSYGRTALEARFARADVGVTEVDRAKSILGQAMDFIEIEDYEQLTVIARAVGVNSRFGITCLDDYQRRIESIEAKLESAESPAQTAKLSCSLNALESARQVSLEKGLLPEHRPTSARKQDDEDDERRYGNEVNRRTRNRAQSALERVERNKHR